MFDKAFTLFHNKKNFGLPVRYLEIKDCKLDVFSAFALPDLFPNLTNLDWNAIDISPNCAHIPRKGIYTTLFRKWKKLEYAIIVMNERFPVINYMLESRVFEYLHYLEIEFSHKNSNSGISISKSLAACINNASALTYLELIGFPIDLDVLEELQNNVPRLEQLDLKKTILITEKNVDFITEDKVSSMVKDGEKIVIQPVKDCFKILNIVICNSQIYALTHHTKETLIQWLQYISKKYPYVQNLTTDFQGNLLQHTIVGELEEHLVSLLSNTKKGPLTGYYMRLHPLTDKIVKAIDGNKAIELEDLELWINESNTQIQFNNLTSLRQKDSVQCLIISDVATRPRENFMYTTIFVDLFERLKGLVVLEIDSNIGCGHNYTLLITILQELPKLCQISIQKFTADPLEDTPIDMNSAIKTDITNVTLGMHIPRTGTRRILSDILNFTLRSCPKLRNFTLKGRFCCGWGPIRLDFNDHNMRKITIDVKRVVFYTFNSTKTPYVEFGVPLRTRITDEFKKSRCFINILYREKDTILELTKGDLEGL